MRRLLAELIVGATLLTVGTVYATPQPSIEAQLDIDGNCAVNFPGDSVLHAKIALGVLPMPTWLPTCRDWYPTYTPTPPPTETPTP